MSRLRRRVVATRRIAIRYTDTKTRTQCRQIMDGALAAIITAQKAQGVTDETLERIALRISTSRKVYDDMDCEIFYYEYDVTALI